ncbi:unnamed protein product [Nippostrongylus brasiliensis]|uniref:Cysteine-rich motor neuron 1 protein (inferred by orthology to a human protein) n=1 Tax=Nippostrongylus brasiliensis TaxID=27835 RepID=A0A0N4YLM3_NIPBR|nr:unnamed protein product [Nippostrongylus brasiliensis]
MAAVVPGASWRTDDCTSCECSADGKVMCYRQQCDADANCHGKPLTVKGRCCPVCEDALSSSLCSFESSVFTVGEEWRQDTCTNCSCQSGGRTVCRQLVCPQCVEPVPIEGHCCPLCKEVVREHVVMRAAVCVEADRLHSAFGRLAALVSEDQVLQLDFLQLGHDDCYQLCVVRSGRARRHPTAHRSSPPTAAASLPVSRVRCAR